MKTQFLIKIKGMLVSLKKLGFIFLLTTATLLSCSKDEIEVPADDPAIMETAFDNVDGEMVTIGFSGGETLHFKKVNEGYLFEGDILFTKEQFEQIQANAQLKGTAAYKWKRWKNNTVPYTISSNLPDSKVNKINAAIDHVESNTNLDFVKRTNEKDFIQFINSSDGMWSTGIGRLGGKQQIAFANWGTKGNCVHEICHAVGMWHEQSRRDRSDHIIIKWDNIKEKRKSQFNKLPSNQGFDVGNFDYGSIMIYSSFNSFAKNTNKPTMTKKDGSTWRGQRNQLSSGDIQALNKMYP